MEDPAQQRYELPIDLEIAIRRTTTWGTMSALKTDNIYFCRSGCVFSNDHSGSMPLTLQKSPLDTNRMPWERDRGLANRMRQECLPVLVASLASDRHHFGSSMNYVGHGCPSQFEHVEHESDRLDSPLPLSRCHSSNKAQIVLVIPLHILGNSTSETPCNRPDE